MRELRTQENEKFQRFFEIVRRQASSLGCIFFCDSGEGHDLLTDDMEGEDLSGWLIPQGSADEFEREWLENDIGEKWDDYMRMAVWHEDQGRVSVTFREF